jgi:PAS domain S-box-containing protein
MISMSEILGKLSSPSLTMKLMVIFVLPTVILSSLGAYLAYLELERAIIGEKTVSISNTLQTFGTTELEDAHRQLIRLDLQNSDVYINQYIQRSFISAQKYAEKYNYEIQFFSGSGEELYKTENSTLDPGHLMTESHTPIWPEITCGKENNHIFCHSFLPNWNISIMFEEADLSKGEIFQNIRWIQSITIVAILAGAFLFGFFYFNKYVLIRVSKLNAALNQLSKGDFASKVIDPHGDELAKIASTFNQVGTNLKQITASKEELEREIRERKRLAAELAKLAAIAEQSPTSIVVTNTKGIIDYVNPTFTAITGYQPFEAIGKTPAILKSGQQDTVFYEELWDTITSGHVWSGITVNKKKDGTFYWSSLIVSPFTNDGEVIGFLGIAEDITKRIETEKELHQAQKIAAVGQLASGIAHDINNMLMPVLGLADLIKMDLTPESRQSKRFDKIVEAASRARDVLKPLVTYSRSDEPHTERIDISATMKRILDIIRPGLPATLMFSVDLPENIGDAEVDESALTSVIMNLGTNARDAMIEGEGQLSFTLTKLNASLLVEENIQGLNTALDYAKISISDNGVGMSAETLDHIFDPFFTTKEVGAGTGIGLSMVHSIISKHNGVVKVISKLGEGTTFNIYLPLVTSEE